MHTPDCCPRRSSFQNLRPKPRRGVHSAALHQVQPACSWSSRRRPARSSSLGLNWTSSLPASASGNVAARQVERVACPEHLFVIGEAIRQPALQYISPVRAQAGMRCPAGRRPIDVNAEGHEVDCVAIMSSCRSSTGPCWSTCAALSFDSPSACWQLLRSDFSPSYGQTRVPDHEAFAPSFSTPPSPSTSRPAAPSMKPAVALLLDRSGRLGPLARTRSGLLVFSG